MIDQQIQAIDKLVTRSINPETAKVVAPKPAAQAPAAAAMGRKRNYDETREVRYPPSSIRDALGSTSSMTLRPSKQRSHMHEQHARRKTTISIEGSPSRAVDQISWGGGLLIDKSESPRTRRTLAELTTNGIMPAMSDDARSDGLFAMGPKTPPRQSRESRPRGEHRKKETALGIRAPRVEVPRSGGRENDPPLPKRRHIPQSPLLDDEFF